MTFLDRLVFPPRWLRRAAVLVVASTSCANLAVSDDTNASPWIPIAERFSTWDAVVAEQLGKSLPFLGKRPYEVSPDGLEATFTQGEDRWTIVGANAPIITPNVWPETWPVKGNEFEVLVLPDPITNDSVLPFSEKLPAVVRTDALRVVGAPDSFEAASFVIRSGDRDLTGVTVEVGDLALPIMPNNPRAGLHVIPRNDVDVRVVKCWYQAGGPLNDTKHKMLKPELLLHDDGLIRIDYAHQVALLRNYDRIEDAPSLRPFTIPRRQNKQLWLTVHIQQGTAPGTYAGPVQVSAGGKKKRLTLVVDVLPFTLPEPAIEYSLYYEGVLANELAFRPEARRKTERQLQADLLDMKAHGLSNTTVAHDVGPDRTKWDSSWNVLRHTLELRRSVGWGTRPLLYLDWRARFADDLSTYRTKVREILALAKSQGIADVFIYGMDERQGREFAALRPVYLAVHDSGAKNFVAINEQTYLLYGRDLIDIPILWGPGIHAKEVADLKRRGVRAWKYSKPQAGLEEPATYRREYGVNLLALGFAGACDYQYQRGSWNDFADPKGRMNTMAYPTLTTPVPTLQWEGWRTAVDDVRYVTYLLREGIAGDEWPQRTCVTDPSKCRTAAIALIASRRAR